MDEDRKKYLARMVRAARRQQGMKQAELAEHVGLTRSQASGLENVSPASPLWTIDLASKVASALSIWPEALTHDHREIAHIIRGRVSSHLSHLGTWDRLAEAIYYLSRDLHKLRPDIVGISILVGHHPLGETRTYTARYDDPGFREQGLRADEERHKRYVAMDVASQDLDDALNVLPYEQAPVHPDAQALEFLYPGGTIQLAIVGEIEVDEPLRSLILHILDEVYKHIERIRQASSGLEQRVADLEKRIQSLESGNLSQ